MAARPHLREEGEHLASEPLVGAGGAVQQDDKMAEGKLVSVEDADAPVKSPSKEFLQEGMGCPSTQCSCW